MNDRIKQKGWVPLSTFAFVESVPPRMNYLEHLLPYSGSDEDLTIPWGVYGTTSSNACAYYAAHYARARKRISVQLTVWYYMDNMSQSISRLPKSLAECLGFMHMGRISNVLRDEVREDLLEIAAEERTPRQVKTLESLNWAPLLMKEPKLVREYLRRQKDVLMIVHPVSQLLDPHQDEAIQVGSFKLKRDRVKMIEARYFPAVTVEI